MKKIILRTLLILLAFILTVIILYMNYVAPGITGYAAKNVASGVFVAGRTQESIEREDINFFPVKLSRNKVDTENHEATGRFLLWRSKAVYNEGLGCTLVKGFSKKEVEKLDYPEVEKPAGRSDTIPWPAGDMIADTVPAGINLDRLNGILDRVFRDTATFRGTFAVLVVYRNQIVAEKYRDDFKPETKFLSWSMAKSFTNAMAGLLVKEGRLDINAPLNLKEWSGDDRKNITLNHLLTMTSGLEFNEAYSKLKLTDATTMLLKKGDMGDYAASKKLVASPGTRWEYSSGTVNIIQDYIRSVIGNDDDYLAYPAEALFNKTGMRSVVWEVDASGTFVGSSYLYATMRDYARFGLLYLHNGNWLGEQLLPEGWVDYTTTPAVGSDGGYGALFWLNKSGQFPGIPSDMFYCDGYDGQRIFIIPSKELVIVRTGCSPRGTFDWIAFLSGILNSLE
ncbi:MAG: serine hydrolase [Bacteroidales bacterium]|nr:serine hydrolase [Bacteroidales bacterium]